MQKVWVPILKVTEQAQILKDYLLDPHLLDLLTFCNETRYSNASSMAGVFHGCFWLLSSWSRSKWGLKSSGNIFQTSHTNLTKGGILPHQATNLVLWTTFMLFIITLKKCSVKPATLDLCLAHVRVHSHICTHACTHAHVCSPCIPTTTLAQILSASSLVRELLSHNKSMLIKPENETNETMYFIRSTVDELASSLSLGEPRQLNRQEH